MYNTSFLPVVNITRLQNLYQGGVCQFWFVPIQHIQTFSYVHPQSQYLQAEPTLKAGTQWLGPVQVPKEFTGYEEKPSISAAGIFYKRKIQGYLPGISGAAHINIGNLMQHQYCIVAQVRNSHLLLVLGNNKVGLRFTHQFGTGIGTKEIAGTPFSFEDECKHKANVISSFSLLPTYVPPPDGIITEDGQFITTEDGQILFIE